jgi:pimeloyl-ACP methyl ester carboxylesterase
MSGPSPLVIILAAMAASLALVVATALFLEARAAQRDRALPPPGRLVDIGGRRLHILCEGGSGEGASVPTVVLEAGGATPAILFRAVQARLAPHARVCLYDRAGFGWSDPAPPGRSFEARADDLARLLEAADLPGPYVLAGESFGGLVVRAFARARPEAVAGLLLIDAAEEETVFADYAAFRRAGAGGLATAPVLARLGLLRRAALRRPDLIGLPADLPMQDRRALVAHMTRPGYWRAARDEIAAYDQVPAERRRAGGFGTLGDLPLTVIAHGRPLRGPNAHLEPRWRAGQQRLAALSTRGRLVVAEDSAHDIALTAPDLVAEELRRLLAQAGEGAAGR